MFTILTSCVFVFQSPNGLISLLDQECKAVRNTDVEFVKKCDSSHRKHPNYALAKLSYPAFTIQHFSGQVRESDIRVLCGIIKEQFSLHRGYMVKRKIILHAVF